MLINASKGKIGKFLHCAQQPTKVSFKWDYISIIIRLLLHASSSTNRIPISAFIPTFLNGTLTKTRTITIHHDARPSHRNVLLSTDDATKQLIAMFGQMVEEIRPLWCARSYIFRFTTTHILLKSLYCILKEFHGGARNAELAESTLFPP